jgi:hypothetical protein
VRQRYGGAGRRGDQRAGGDDKAVHYFQQQGKKVLRIADYPGLLVWRTVAMLVNEALDALQKGVASAQDIDTAMRLGVNYPQGPLAWGKASAGAACCACWRTCNTIMARALSPLFVAPEGADGEHHNMAQRARCTKRYLRQNDGDRTYRRWFCADDHDRLAGHA